MNMQQMLAQAQKIQREIKKAKDALYQQEFEASKGGAVTVKMLGNKSITSIKFEEGLLEEDNKEMIEEMLIACINELIEKIEDEEAAIEEKYAGRGF